MNRDDDIVCVIQVCECCVMSRESEHDTDECGDCQHRGRKPWSAIPAGHTVTMGMVAEEHECGRERGEDVDECDCGFDTFSSVRCGGCGTTTAGPREAYTLWRDAS